RRRFKRNAKNYFIVVPRLNRWMTNDRFLLRQRKEIDCRMFRESLARDLQAKIGSNPAPIGTRHIGSRQVLREQAPIPRKNVGVRRLACRRYGQIQLQCCATRDADFFTDQPTGFSRELYGRSVELRWRRDFLHQQNFICVAVSFKIARIDGLQRDWPLDVADLPTRRQFPFQFGGQACVAGKFPVGVPARGHLQQDPYGERLSGNDRVCVGQELRPNELFSLVGLGYTVWYYT